MIPAIKKPHTASSKLPTKSAKLRYQSKTLVMQAPVSSNVRAISLSSALWMKQIRPRILLRDAYTCKECGGAGNQVDHVDGDHSNNDDSNLQTLCVVCHSKKTARENGGFGNRKNVAVRS